MKRMTKAHILSLMAAVALAGACSGGDTEEPAAQPAAEAAPAAQAVVAEPTGEIDADLATQGESLFQTKACMGCHTVGGGRMAGPDLDGVTGRREFAWIVGMVTRPDSMLRDDDAAKALLAEYGTPMAPLGVTQAEAVALFEYLRRESQ
jgi:mono/diheme cytochrome c family protein